MDLRKRVALQKMNQGVIVLFQIGSIFKVYNEGVFLMKEKRFIVNVQNANVPGCYVLCVAISGNIFEDLKKEFVIKENKYERYFLLHGRKTFEKEVYSIWRDEYISIREK